MVWSFYWSCRWLVAGGHDEDAERKARNVAESWLGLIDNGDYGLGYDEASDYFKKSVTRDKWIETLELVRTPLGEVGKRKLKSSHFETQYGDAPEGKYVRLKYRDIFGKDVYVDEFVTLKKDFDGQWRVVGYYLKKKWTSIW